MMRGLIDMLSSFFRERKVLAGAIIGLFIPAIYCFFYLNTIWDPYGKTAQVPAVIVNLDTPASLSGESINVGKELTDRLIKDKYFNWRVMGDESQALADMREEKNLIILTIPAGFSQSIADVTKDNTDKVTPKPIRYYANQGESFIVSQMGDRMTAALRESLNDQVSAKIMNKLIDAVGQGTTGFMQGADAMKQISDGANQLADGSKKLADSLGQAEAGAGKLGQGAKEAEIGSAKLSDGILQFTQGSEQISKQLAQSQTAVQGIDSKLKEISATPGLSKETVQALSALSAQTSQLGAAMGQGSQAASSLAAGEKLALDKSKALTTGLGQLDQGLQSLNQGLTQGRQGANSIYTNILKLQSGANTLQTKFNEAGNTSNPLKGKVDVLNAPVNFQKVAINPVPNNGTFFSGFFAPLSLWVGAIVFSFLTVMVKWRGWARRSLLPRYILLAVMGVVQSLVLDWVLIKLLGLQVNDLPLFIWMTILTSLTFISIVHFVFAMTGFAGNVIVLILLVFQLGLSGGSYPVALLSDINQHLSGWVPLTYAVQGFRIAISGGSGSVLQSQIGHLLIFFAAGIGLHLLYGGISWLDSYKKRNKREQSKLIIKEQT
jgi:putative membrane protein